MLIQTVEKLSKMFDQQVVLFICLSFKKKQTNCFSCAQSMRPSMFSLCLVCCAKFSKKIIKKILMRT